MQAPPDIALIVESLLKATTPCIRYFHALLERGLPAEAEGEVHGQRLLVLYLCIVGCDLLQDNWLPAHRHACSTEDGADSIDPLAAAVEDELRQCYDAETGGFHPERVTRFTTTASVSMTHCALQVLLVTGTLRRAARSWLSVNRTLGFILACQDAGGSGGFFAAPEVTEMDVRFTYSAFMCFVMLQSLTEGHGADSSSVLRARVERSVRLALPFLVGCWHSAEGGFGAAPSRSTECHGGMTFCAVASLAMARSFVGSLVFTAAFLSRLRRYVVCRVARGPEDEGLYTEFPVRAIGFQGRPGKTCDTCYSHWLGATLALIARAEAAEVDGAVVAQFGALCLDSNTGDGGLGVMSRSTDAEPDIVHATLGLSGVLVVLAHSGLPCGKLWQSASPPHPVYGCSERTAAYANLPVIRSLLE